MVPKPSKFTSDGGWQRSGKTFHWANDRFALHSRFSIVGCKLPWPKIPWFELRMSQYFSCGKPSNGSSNSFHVFCQTIGIPSNLFLRSSVYISIKHRQIAAQSLKFALHNRSSIIVGCKLPWHKICWFQQSRNFQKEVEVVMSGVRSPFFSSFSARPIIGLPKCSLLAAATTDLTFRMRLNISVARYLWNVWCLQLGLWLGLAKVVEAPAHDQRLRLTRNYPSRTSSMK